MLAAEVGSAALRSELPGRRILHKFAAAADIQPGRLKQMYLHVADQAETFKDIIEIFEGFRAGVPARSPCPPGIGAPVMPARWGTLSKQL